jgi:TolA-binding protein
MGKAKAKAKTPTRRAKRSEAQDRARRKRRAERIRRIEAQTRERERVGQIEKNLSKVSGRLERLRLAAQAHMDAAEAFRLYGGSIRREALKSSHEQLRSIIVTLGLQ